MLERAREVRGPRPPTAACDEDARARLGQQLGRLRLVQHREARRHVRPRTGTRCSMRSQKAWIVSILSPPGVSTARGEEAARRGRGRAVRAARPSGRRSGSARATARRASPSRRACAKTRIVISAAAALVKVRHRMRDGGAPSSRRRITRSVRTRVLPAPALADTQAEARGSAARRWRCERVGRDDEVDAHGSAPPRRAAGRATIPSRGRGGRRARSVRAYWA